MSIDQTTIIVLCVPKDNITKFVSILINYDFKSYKIKFVPAIFIPTIVHIISIV